MSNKNDNRIASSVIIYRDNKCNPQRCGVGVLISPRWALTAAHILKTNPALRPRYYWIRNFLGEESSDIDIIGSEVRSESEAPIINSGRGEMEELMLIRLAEDARRESGYRVTYLGSPNSSSDTSHIAVTRLSGEDNGISISNLSRTCESNTRIFAEPYAASDFLQGCDSGGGWFSTHRVPILLGIHQGGSEHTQHLVATRITKKDATWITNKIRGN